jgi:hypothetical protein
MNYICAILLILALLIVVFVIFALATHGGSDAHIRLIAAERRAKEQQHYADYLAGRELDPRD